MNAFIIWNFIHLQLVFHPQRIRRNQNIILLFIYKQVMIQHVYFP